MAPTYSFLSLQNIFYNRKISRVFDLKGSLRGRFAAQVQSSKEDFRSETPPLPPDTASAAGNSKYSSDADSGIRSLDKTAGSERGEPDDAQSNSSKGASGTQLDGDFLEFTRGRPMPLNDRAKSLFHMSIQNVSTGLFFTCQLNY